MSALRPIGERINAERFVLFGWSRAILLQLAHPLVAAGVAQSAFRDSTAASVRRLHHTVRAMLSLAFGTRESREAAVANIREIHTRINGRLDRDVGIFPAGTFYSAEDPALLLWVHATLIESTTLVYDALVTEVTPKERDTYCAEAAWLPIALGARPEDIPRDWASLERYMTGISSAGTLVVGPKAQEIAHALLFGGFSRLVGPLATINRRLTLAWLPPEIRDQYDAQWQAIDERKALRIRERLRGLRRRLPDAIALWPEARRGPKDTMEARRV